MDYINEKGTFPYRDFIKICTKSLAETSTLATHLCDDFGWRVSRTITNDDGSFVVFLNRKKVEGVKDGAND